jgi:hypothetical protein
LKIWRYVDLAKFLHMLATGTLYFPCAATELKDPYEGYLPRSHIEPERQLMRDYIAQEPTRDPGLLRRLETHFLGVSCWHINEHESEAMWQLYTAMGQGIAIESTKARLEGALGNDGIIVDQVRYIDFESDEIEKGHKRYAGFLKRSRSRMNRNFGPRSGCLRPAPGPPCRATSTP